MRRRKSFGMRRNGHSDCDKQDMGRDAAQINGRTVESQTILQAYALSTT